LALFVAAGAAEGEEIAEKLSAFGVLKGHGFKPLISRFFR
jgi:hypothetical protein